MRKPEDIVAGVLAAAGGTLIGRVRMQKVFYLLDQLGLQSGFDYEYHYYGPYSANLSTAVADARAFGVIDEESKYRASDGVPYSVYKLRDNLRHGSNQFGQLGRMKAEKVLTRLKDEDATVLELAATIHWLRNRERLANWSEELRHRKGAKVQGGRASKAEKLLTELGLN